MTISNEKISLILDILRKTALDYPRAFNNCHANNNTHPERLDFIILSTRRMWGHSGLIGSNNERVGMNGKRGISSDPSSDAIAFGINRDVVIADILERAGAHNGDINKISWNDVTEASKPFGGGILINPFLWNTFVDYGGVTPPVEPPIPPKPPVIPYNENFSIEFGLLANDVYTQSGANQDPGMISVHSQRAAWDYYVGGLTWSDSKQKHINGLRAVYGLPPI
jgi:hypothetical protein